MKDNISIGLLGLGVVGSGVIKLIENHQEELKHQLGGNIHVKSALVRDLNKSRDIDSTDVNLTTNPYEIIEDPEVDIIIEVIGGIEKARDYILDSFKNKKHVVTANKDLIALHGPELHDTANENGCDLFYEASVAGGIPILRGLTDGLVSDRIQKVMGIVNGTSNYILSKMDNDGMSFDDALKQAQELGFAEADPTADINGLDAARKMAILARLAFYTNVDLDEVEMQGIEDIALDDIQYGKKLGYIMKLIGYAHIRKHHLEVHVQPTYLAGDHPLASVKDENNAVYVYGEAVGETMFYGPGAGSLPTATAIVSDVVEVAKSMRLGVNGHQFTKPLFTKELKTNEERHGKYYIRLHVKDEVGAFSTISALFNKHDISFERILQTPYKRDELAEIILVTHHTSLAAFAVAWGQLKDLDVVKEVKSHYRVEGAVE